MRQNARQHREAQRQRVAQQRDNTAWQPVFSHGQAQHEQRSRQGAYVALAGLAHVDPATLLGGLRALATLRTDPDLLRTSGTCHDAMSDDQPTLAMGERLSNARRKEDL